MTVTISFFGIDGIGKSTLAKALEQRLTEAGHPAALVSRRRYLKDSSNSGLLRDMIISSYEAALRAMYGLADATPALDELFANRSKRELLDSGFEMMLASATIRGNQAEAILASSLADIASYKMYAYALGSAPDAPSVYVHETNGIKSVIKGVVLVERCTTDPRILDEAARIVELATAVLRPHPREIAIHVRGDAQRALEQRVRQHGRPGGMEHFGLVGGDTSGSAFVEFQDGLQQKFDRVAAEWDSLEIVMDNRPLAENIDSAVSQVAIALKQFGVDFQ